MGGILQDSGQGFVVGGRSEQLEAWEQLEPGRISDDHDQMIRKNHTFGADESSHQEANQDVSSPTL